MSLTRHWSQDGCLSQIVLTHDLRQATVWLSFDVRHSEGGFASEESNFSLLILTILYRLPGRNVKKYDAHILL